MAKFGYRKPSPKKSLSAKTTGKIKRQAKGSINPMYGKKGAGWINDPEKAAYNKIYNKTTTSIFDESGCGIGCGCVVVIIIILGVILSFLNSFIDSVLS